ncbi:hypothetical protein J437_LFUL019427 [Ladona fulva]|uniref:Uncharacterized protein n=1 Tax=Ladona fulva TaxID=123851 RepID=A0A8K0KRQ8_LADFU|nr:hypothetical protein J437_LFUL019427 [Ladona fulva]
MIVTDNIIRWHYIYLRQLKKYRREWRKIVYIDETWINIGQTVNKAWREQVIKTPRDAFLSGLSTGQKMDLLKGHYSFFCKKKIKEEHEEVDEDSYESYLLSNVPRGSVIVLGQCLKIGIFTFNKLEERQHQGVVDQQKYKLR